MLILYSRWTFNSLAVDQILIVSETPHVISFEPSKEDSSIYISPNAILDGISSVLYNRLLKNACSLKK